MSHTAEKDAGLLDDYDPTIGLIARGVMADPAEHDPDSCEYACCVTPPAKTGEAKA